MNQDNEALKDVRIRRAIQHAIDRPTVVDAAYFGAAAVGNGIVAPGLPGARDGVTYDYDPDKARALLAEAGATNLSVTLDILNQSETPDGSAGDPGEPGRCWDHLRDQAERQRHLLDAGLEGRRLLHGPATDPEPFLDAAGPELGRRSGSRPNRSVSGTGSGSTTPSTRRCMTRGWSRTIRQSATRSTRKCRA